MVEVGKVYVEVVEVHSSLKLHRHWKVLYKVSEEKCFVTDEAGRYEIKNISKLKEGYPLAERQESLKRLLSK